VDLWSLTKILLATFDTPTNIPDNRLQENTRQNGRLKTPATMGPRSEKDSRSAFRAVATILKEDKEISSFACAYHSISREMGAHVGDVVCHLENTCILQINADV